MGNILIMLSDWKEYIVSSGKYAGKKYYYNVNTKKSTWSKPNDLMSFAEKADMTTDWREHSYLDGRSYFYNIKTKVSQWQMPEEIKCARLNLESEKISYNKEDEKNNRIVKKKMVKQRRRT